MTKPTPSPSKPKSPRRSDAEIAADYAARAQAAKLRDVKASPKWQAVDGAIDALLELEIPDFAQGTQGAIATVLDALRDQRNFLEGTTPKSTTP